MAIASSECLQATYLPERHSFALWMRDQDVAALHTAAGDLATGPFSTSISSCRQLDTFDVLREYGLIDLVGDADTRASRYTKPVRHASYLLVPSTAAVRNFEVVDEPEVSDQRALMLEI